MTSKFIKVWTVTGLKKSVKAATLNELKEKGSVKLNIEVAPDKLTVFLDDGTEVDDDEVFESLAEGTVTYLCLEGEHSTLPLDTAKDSRYSKQQGGEEKQPKVISFPSSQGIKLPQADNAWKPCIARQCPEKKSVETIEQSTTTSQLGTMMSSSNSLTHGVKDSSSLLESQHASSQKPRKRKGKDDDGTQKEPLPKKPRKKPHWKSKPPKEGEQSADPQTAYSCSVSTTSGNTDPSQTERPAESSKVSGKEQKRYCVNQIKSSSTTSSSSNQLSSNSNDEKVSSVPEVSKVFSEPKSIQRTPISSLKSTTILPVPSSSTQMPAFVRDVPDKSIEMEEKLSNFGAPVPTTTATTGFNFSTPQTGSTFSGSGTAAASAPSAFGTPAAPANSDFDTAPANSAFGTPATSTASVFGMPAVTSAFGIPATTAAASSATNQPVDPDPEEGLPPMPPIQLTPVTPADPSHNDENSVVEPIHESAEVMPDIAVPALDIQFGTDSSPFDFTASDNSKTYQDMSQSSNQTSSHVSNQPLSSNMTSQSSYNSSLPSSVTMSKDTSAYSLGSHSRPQPSHRGHATHQCDVNLPYNFIRRVTPCGTARYWHPKYLTINTISAMRRVIHNMKVPFNENLKKFKGCMCQDSNVDVVS